MKVPGLVYLMVAPFFTWILYPVSVGFAPNINMIVTGASPSFAGIPAVRVVVRGFLARETVGWLVGGLVWALVGGMVGGLVGALVGGLVGALVGGTILCFGVGLLKRKRCEYSGRNLNCEDSNRDLNLPGGDSVTGAEVWKYFTKV